MLMYQKCNSGCFIPTPFCYLINQHARTSKNSSDLHLNLINNRHKHPSFWLKIVTHKINQSLISPLAHGPSEPSCNVHSYIYKYIHMEMCLCVCFHKIHQFPCWHVDHVNPLMQFMCVCVCACRVWVSNHDSQSAEPNTEMSATGASLDMSSCVTVSCCCYRHQTLAHF